MSRSALDELAQGNRKGVPFDPASLTEDYELGLAISEQGGRCRFVRARGQDDQLVATRAYFPSGLGQIVRQKTRWVHGIALQGWDRTGWAGGVAETWMRARDRRGPFTALVLALGYLLLILTLVISIAGAFGVSPPMAISPLMFGLITANLCFLGWRIAWQACYRFATE